jgi:serine protease Do
MPHQLTTHLWRHAVIICLVAVCLDPARGNCDDARMTPLVKAVQKVRESVVNIRGRKLVHPDQQLVQSDDPIKQVNGMGTGIIIDPRGFILTNYHVVHDVRQIQVTTHDRKSAIANLIAHDPKTDLAILKIDLDEPLKVIPMGTSSDLMSAETVAAIGNAYGYRDSVSSGIISALGRTVQVSDDQTYYNLIQTSAPINPGNSGGPLINIHGDMIGVNVAVRVGAQNIAFAIPIDDAMEVAAELMSQIVGQSVNTGVQLKTDWVNNQPQVVIRQLSDQSSAARCGIQSGDVIESVQGQPCPRSFDFFRHLIGRMPDDEISIGIRRDGEFKTVAYKLDIASQRNINTPAWNQLGISVAQVGPNVLNRISSKYSRGLKIESVRPGSPAQEEGIQPGDILVAIHTWRTESLDNLDYILNRPEIVNGEHVRFFILRGNDPLWGQIRMASH